MDGKLRFFGVYGGYEVQRDGVVLGRVGPAGTKKNEWRAWGRGLPDDTHKWLFPTRKEAAKWLAEERDRTPTQTY